MRQIDLLLQGYHSSQRQGGLAVAASCMRMRMCVRMHVSSGTLRIQKSVWEELEFQAIVSYQDAENPSWVLWKSSKCLLSHLSRRSLTILMYNPFLLSVFILSYIIS